MVFDLYPPLLIGALVGGYLLGSIPFGILVMRAAGAGDPRAIGSGNIGATNVLRSGRRGLAALTVLGDGGKGALAVLAAWLATRASAPDAQLELMAVAGGAAFVGHLFPVWLRFRGGKGVATFLGTLLALCWPVGLAVCATWAVSAAVFRMSSLAALIAAATSGVWLFAFGQGRMLALVLILTLLIYIRHWANLERIKAGTEPKIGEKKSGG